MSLASLQLRGDAIPKFVENPGVEERGSPNDLCIFHLKEPGVGVAIRQAVSPSCIDIEQDYDHVAVGINAPDSSYRRLRHSGVKRLTNLLHKLLATIISLRQR